MLPRARAFEHRSGTDGTSDPLVWTSGYYISIQPLPFDIRIIIVTMSGIPSGGTTVGAKVTGSTSGLWIYSLGIRLSNQSMLLVLSTLVKNLFQHHLLKLMKFLRIVQMQT